jgi:hypothetical protein
VNKFGIGAKGSGVEVPHVLYDKATSKFKEVNDIKERHELFKRAGLVEG